MECGEYRWPTADVDLLVHPFLSSIRATGAVSVLDLGCGDGWLATQYLGLPTVQRVVGLDCDEDMIVRANEHKISSDITYHCLDMRDVGTLDDTFDLAVSTLALQMLGTQSKLEQVLAQLPAPRLIGLIPHPCLIEKNTEHAVYTFPENFDYHAGQQQYRVSLHHGTGMSIFGSQHMPLACYFNALTNADFGKIRITEYGGKRLPHFLQFDAQREEKY